MATAKRVSQDAKYERVETPSVVQYWKVLTTDGVETRRDAMIPPVTNTFVSQKRIPQPDRIVLEMSVEEATAFERIVGDLSSGDALDEVYDAVADALKMSPTTGTQTSPAKDAACGVADKNYNSRYHEAQENRS